MHSCMLQGNVRLAVYYPSCQGRLLLPQHQWPLDIVVDLAVGPRDTI